MTDQGADQETSASPFFLLTNGERSIIQKQILEGFAVVGEPVMAADFMSAKRMLADRVAELERIKAAVREGAMQLFGGSSDLDSLDGDEFSLGDTFASVSEALRFALQFRGKHSPATPMSRMVKSGAIGKGSGLVGLDAAGQAGMILGSLERSLDAEQKAVLTVRFGAAVQEACACCGSIGHPQWWMEAVSVLSLVPELRDLPKAIRMAVVMKTVGRKKLRVQSKADGYEVTERQIRRRVSSAKDYFTRIENTALGVLQAHFSAERH